VTTRQTNVFSLLQEVGLPAVRIKPVSAEVIEFNELFSSLFDVRAPLDRRLWFVDRILPHVHAEDRTRWESAFANRTPVQVHISFRSVAGGNMDFEMRSFASLGTKKLARSILCVFVPLANPVFARVCDAHLSLGRELERRRIRTELHKGVAQQLLGAAFGCKVLAGKAAKLSEELGKEASDLAELVNESVIELQNLVQSDQIQS
jgi:signal transduction histidine kinase